MVDWAQLPDSSFEVEHVPRLLERVTLHDDPAAWAELEWRLVLEHDLVSPAGFAALPQLVRLAPRSAEARALAGRILERAAGHHGQDELLADRADAVAEFGRVLDDHLRSRPADYLVSLRARLAVAGEFHWANALEGFTDDIHHVRCPHCGAELTVAIGRFGCYAQLWDGPVELRRELRPAAGTELTGTGRWLYRTALRDGQDTLAEGFRHLFGTVECPDCGSLCNLASEYTFANRPVMR
ncbi:hypothetical protein [Kitasatospora cheerisanensis]|uniref:Uncharacterized protein n=1 Tax=Kitasatospora cheerisanensis KCTC 2395 TaxID=1348663 RepID=A0A066ZBY3_9ACTN|nr:hypothetical protein [Kitasatospora cheerisanensis]KDN87821.1 hypothetical protein KCH_04680 [Kitasatospora cheerisanensis KCTC 2395]